MDVKEMSKMDSIPERRADFMPKKKTAHYKIISDSGGNRYKFFCDLTEALFCTTVAYNEADPAKELELAWEKEGKKNFQLCHKCGKWVIDAMYNADALECVACAPWEDTPKFCKFCGTRVSASDAICPECGKHLIYGGSFHDT